jgi:hypothetical protein
MFNLHKNGQWSIPVGDWDLASGKSKRGHRTRVDKMLVPDGRVRLARSIRDARAAYLGMVSQPVSPVDYSLCERLAVIGAQLLELDRRALLPAGLGSTDARLYVMLSGLHSRLLRQLNARRTARPQGPSLEEILGEAAA